MNKLVGRGHNASKDILRLLLEKKSKEWIEKTVDAFLIHSQVPEIGSVVYCNLVVALEHTGIYVGDGKVVHLKGNGIIEAVSFREFIGRLGGRNFSYSIFCATDVNGKSIGSKEVAKRALEMIGKKQKYNLLFDNCHCFTTYCLTGTKYPIGSFTMVEEILRSKFGFVKWRAVNLS